MEPIPDDPIIACMERTGYPPWHYGYDTGWSALGGRSRYDYDDYDDDEEEEEEDVQNDLCDG